MKKKYSEEEINFLTNNYGIISTEEISKILNRTISSIKCKVRSLGLKIEEWSEDEISLLIDNWDFFDARYISKNIFSHIPFML